MNEQAMETVEALETLLSEIFDVKPTEYMVFVEGRSAPQVRHQTYESAATEAERLARLPNNRGCAVHVMAVVATLVPAHVWQ